MSDEVKVTTLKGFDNQGQYVGRGRVIKVAELRARELERNGLVTREEKKAPEPQNKKAPEPKNKASYAPNSKDY